LHARIGKEQRLIAGIEGLLEVLIDKQTSILRSGSAREKANGDIKNDKIHQITLLGFTVYPYIFDNCLACTRCLCVIV
jgi:hypothetical protein